MSTVCWVGTDRGAAPAEGHQEVGITDFSPFVISIYLSSILTRLAYYPCSSTAPGASPGQGLAICHVIRYPRAHVVSLAKRELQGRWPTTARHGEARQFLGQWCLNEKVELRCKLAMPRLSSGAYEKVELLCKLAMPRLSSGV